MLAHVPFVVAASPQTLQTRPMLLPPPGLEPEQRPLLPQSVFDVRK